ncbi:hypothetical protein Tco_0329248 [Tanacetum coccineum]
MSGVIPPIPPPFGASSGNLGSPKANRVDTMPTTTEPINTTTTTNAGKGEITVMENSASKRSDILLIREGYSPNNINSTYKKRMQCLPLSVDEDVKERLLAEAGGADSSFRSVGERVKKDPCFTMESALIHSLGWWISVDLRSIDVVFAR